MKTEDYDSIDIERVNEIVAHAHGGNKSIVECKDFVAGVKAALHYLDLRPKQKKLTPTEAYCAGDVISRVVDAMSLNKESGQYEDAGNFVFSCSKSDYAALKRAYKKL